MRNLQFLSTFSSDFPVRDSWEFPQNCYLGKRREEGEMEMREEEKGVRRREDEGGEGMMREGEGNMIEE